MYRVAFHFRSVRHVSTAESALGPRVAPRGRHPKLREHSRNEAAAGLPGRFITMRLQVPKKVNSEFSEINLSERQEKSPTDECSLFFFLKMEPRHHTTCLDLLMRCIDGN